mmetsp:Transcript_55050/g.101895  ORF Transcript_55050/g.101895 Transcript_55050/m.101895 type:complete len:119 (+) Transcript_55050:305-661(+)
MICPPSPVAATVPCGRPPTPPSAKMAGLEQHSMLNAAPWPGFAQEAIRPFSISSIVLTGIASMSLVEVSCSRRRFFCNLVQHADEPTPIHASPYGATSDLRRQISFGLHGPQAWADMA